MNNLGNILNKVSTSLSSDLTNILSKVDEIISKVVELEELIKKVKELEGKLSSEKAKTAGERNETNIRNYENQIKESETSFKKICDDALNLLNEVKGMDASLSFVSEFTITDYRSKLGQLSFGSFTHEPIFHASNGVDIEFYLYLPDYGEEVEGLPMHIYFPGSSEANGSGALNNGLGYLLDTQAITPEGPCIIIQGHNNYDNAKYQEALIELFDTMAEEYNVDKNKISLSGHSWGANTGYELVKNNPGYFSAFVPISGRDKVDVGYTDTKIWGIHGSNDLNIEYESGINSIENIANAGGDAEMYTLEGEKHAIQTKVFQEEYEREDGEIINPLEWAFQQSLKA